MKKSITILENISQKCHSDTTVYKFNKDKSISTKYRKGRIDASNWINDLIYYYIQKEKNFLKEFLKHMEDQKDSIAIVNQGDYKNGLLDQLNEIEKAIKLT